MHINVFRRLVGVVVLSLVRKRTGGNHLLFCHLCIMTYRLFFFILTVLHTYSMVGRENEHVSPFFIYSQSSRLQLVPLRHDCLMDLYGNSKICVNYLINVILQVFLELYKQ